MQKIVKFYVREDIDSQIQDYIDNNSTDTITSLIALNNAGNEIIIALVDDGQ